MIIPARWYNGGIGLASFREDMFGDNRLCKLYDYYNSKDCFPTVVIPGGLCYFCGIEIQKGSAWYAMF